MFWISYDAVAYGSVLGIRRLEQTKCEGLLLVVVSEWREDGGRVIKVPNLLYILLLAIILIHHKPGNPTDQQGQIDELLEGLVGCLRD